MIYFTSDKKSEVFEQKGANDGFINIFIPHPAPIPREAKTVKSNLPIISIVISPAVMSDSAVDI